MMVLVPLAVAGLVVGGGVEYGCEGSRFGLGSCMNALSGRSDVGNGGKAAECWSARWCGVVGK